MMNASPRWKQRPEGSTWGDFGPDDQLGRLNLLTPEKVKQGIAEVREGLSFCLSLPLDYPGGNALNPLLEGREDALLGSGMLFAMASEKKLNDVMDLATYKIPVAGSSILAEKNWLQANRDTAARFVKAAIEADALMKTNRAAFNAALVKWFNIKDAPTQDGMYREALEIPKALPPN